MLLGSLSGLGEGFSTAAPDGTQEQDQPAAAHHVGTVPLEKRHPTPSTGRYSLPGWVVVPPDLQLPIRTGQLPGWSPAATVLDFHLPDQLRRSIPRAHLNAWITVFEQQERTALAALDEAAADGILAAVTVCDGSCGKVDLVGVLFNLRFTP